MENNIEGNKVKPYDLAWNKGPETQALRTKQYLSNKDYLVSSWRQLTNASSTERTRCLDRRLSLTREANSSTWKLVCAKQYKLNKHFTRAGREGINSRQEHSVQEVDKTTLEPQTFQVCPITLLEQQNNSHHE